MILKIPENAAVRMDKYLKEQLPEYSRSYLQNLIDSGMVTVNGKPVPAKTQLKQGDVVEIDFPALQPLEVAAEDIPIDIVYQDGDIAVVNKAQGMVVHPAPGNLSGTLVNALLYHLDGLSGINGVVRPGIVHRLDKDTSGLLIVAKNDEAHQSLAQQIKDKLAEKTYLALVHGNIKQDTGTVDLPIGRHKIDRKKMAVTKDGREAVTHYRVLARYGQYTLLKIRLETGRTHQIRVHFAHLGHSVVGDPVYGPQKCPFPLNGQLLHAAKLKLAHPRTGEAVSFYAPLPEHFRSVLEKLEKA